MRTHADVVVVGAGIMGLSIAYHLARNGVKNVTVVDKSYLCSGASGRNGGGVRAQWSTEANVRLMQESIRLCQDFASEFKINVWLRQGGYLFLARNAERLRELEQSCKLQRDCGLSTRMLSPREAQKIVPELSLEGVVAATFSPDDGVVFPWPFVWGFAQAATKLGVEIATFTEVTGIDLRGTTRGAVIEGVRLRRLESASEDHPKARGSEITIRTNKIVNAAGAWSPEIAKLAGVELPNKPHRHEICSTEPLKPWLKPLVADLGSGLYFSQSTRGEIVGGISQHRVPGGLDQNSSHAFLGLYARALTAACPILGQVKVLRQWSGCYDVTPDANPIVGGVDEVEHFYQASGFMGHGFMMAPVMGKLIGEHIAKGSDLPLFERWNLRRFKEGRLLSEGMILG
ncbi:MAG: Sarcosine oxidase beta subunit [Labilithrix sp.]|nr:Sarcosine oxidase beta subunit [Labilithrix sp.]